MASSHTASTTPAPPFFPTDTSQTAMGSMLSLPPLDSILPSHLVPIAAPGSRKRRASTPPIDDGLVHKRLKATPDAATTGVFDASAIDGRALADELAQELQCACCAATVYRPVISRPCEHFFCGSCIALWIRNGGSNCPACRGVSMSCTPSRSLEKMAAILIRHDPSQARAPREREQADEVYKGGPLTIPPPRESSPPPQIPTGDITDFARPCPHCAPGNPLRWTCPQPVPDPAEGLEGAWHLDDGPPPGHGWCGNCEDLLALSAPATTKCDLCHVAFCGLGVPDRCVALPLLSQRPHRFNSATDLLLTSDIYEAFDSNAVEVEYFVDHLEALRLSPRDVYREIIHQILEDPRRFAPLIEDELFVDMHTVPSAGGADLDPTAPRNRICRMCASEVLLWGIRDWWVREHAKGRCVAHVSARPDCAEGRSCMRQDDQTHAREFNHMIVPPPKYDARVLAAPPVPPVPVPVAEEKIATSVGSYI